MLNVGNPEQAIQLSLLPSAGVGLARMEFIFAGWVGVHPLALTRYDTLAPAVQREVDRGHGGLRGQDAGSSSTGWRRASAPSPRRSGRDR